jgi:hypothetical protein
VIVDVLIIRSITGAVQQDLTSVNTVGEDGDEQGDSQREAAPSCNQHHITCALNSCVRVRS